MNVRGRTRLRFARALGLCLLAVARVAVADEPRADAETKFLRISRADDGTPLALETALSIFERGQGRDRVEVTLVGAVHIGERAYYEELNRRFTNYDVVLYELVAPRGTRVPLGGGGSNHPVSLLQDGMRRMLDLDSQVARIDYHAENFVHADMSPEDFERSMEDKGENMWAMFGRMLAHSLTQPVDPSKQAAEADLLQALLEPDRPESLKRALAAQFEDLDGLMQALEGPEGSTLISERNKVALNVLDEQIGLGKRKVAIFYGAGHLSDMSQRLRDEHGFRALGSEWLVAWDLRDAKLRNSRTDVSGAAAKQRRPRVSPDEAALDPRFQ